MAERSGAGASQGGSGADRRRSSRSQATRRGSAGSGAAGARSASSRGASGTGRSQAQRATGSSRQGTRRTGSATRRPAGSGATGGTDARTRTNQGDAPNYSLEFDRASGSSAANLARARRARAYREAQRRRRRRRAAFGVGASVLCLLALFFLVRGAVGCASKRLAPKEKGQTPIVEDVLVQEASAPVQIQLVMIGDILQHSGVYQSGFYDDGSRNYDHVFAHILDQLEGADIKVLNQETLLGGESFGFSGYPTFNGPQEMGDAEVKAGFNVVLRATNHALDRGYDGLASELSFWRNSHPEVAVLGAIDPNDSSASLDDVYVFEKDGFKVALLNYTYDLNGFEDPRGVVSTLDEDHVRRTVTAAHEMADMVVVFPHWGEEYNLTPVQEQYDMAQIFMDCGADAIIGGHPHVIEPVEILTASDGRKVPCFWSVGNFISTQVDNENLIGGVARVTMQKDADGSCSITACSFLPTVTHKGIGTSMTTYLLRDYTDELAYSNYLELNGTDNTSLTVAWANEFCTQVLGSGFDAAGAQISFGSDVLTASQPQQQEQDAADAETEGGEGAEELDQAA